MRARVCSTLNSGHALHPLGCVRGKESELWRSIRLRRRSTDTAALRVIIVSYSGAVAMEALVRNRSGFSQGRSRISFYAADADAISVRAPIRIGGSGKTEDHG